VDGRLTFNHIPVVLQAAADGFGLACVLEDQAADLLAKGKLVRALEDWCPPFAGYHLYYPDRRQLPPAFRLVVEALSRGI
jgi:DNA-binding transcriptional LysR family regulator